MQRYGWNDLIANIIIIIIIVTLFKWSMVFLILYSSSTAVEHRASNRRSPGSNPFCVVSKLVHFRSLHDATVHMYVRKL